MTDQQIATIPKNSRERVVVALGEFTKDGQTFDMVCGPCMTA